MLGSAILVEHGSFSRRPPLHLPKRLLNAAAFMMIGGRVLPSVRHKRAYRAYEPDIDRAAEGLSRAASAAIAGAADAGVRARHRARRRHHRRQLRARTVAQSGARKRRRGAAADQRSGPPAIPSARAFSRRSQFSGPAGSGPPRFAVAGVAMADPRRRA